MINNTTILEQDGTPDLELEVPMQPSQVTGSIDNPSGTSNLNRTDLRSDKDAEGDQSSKNNQLMLNPMQEIDNGTEKAKISYT